MNAQDREPVSCHERALRLLTRRPHFRQELARKLNQRGYEDDEVVATLDRLESQGLLGDAATAQQFVDAKRRRGPLGTSRLRAELVRRGASSDATAAALRSTDPGEEAERAAQAARRWLVTHRGGGDAFRAKLARHLAGKGFSAGLISQTLRSALDGAANAGIRD